MHHNGLLGMLRNKQSMMDIFSTCISPYSSVTDSFFCLSSHTAVVNRSKLTDTLLTCHLCRSVHLQSIQFILFVQLHHSLHGAVCRDAECSTERSKVWPGCCVGVTGSLAWGQRLQGYSRMVRDLALHHRASVWESKSFIWGRILSICFKLTSHSTCCYEIRWRAQANSAPLGNSGLVRIVPVV